MRVSKLMVAAGVVAAGLIGFGGVADAAPAPPTAVVTCANGDGVVSLITDDSGVQRQACVASAASGPALPPARASLSAPAAHTASARAQATLPATGAGTDGLVIAAVLVGSGSVVSLLSRRRTAARRKGFRRRRLTS